MELYELNQRDENESKDSNKKLSLKQLNIMKNAWKNMDQRRQKKFKREVHQKLKSDNEIKDFDYFVEYLDKTNVSQEDIPYKNEQGECIIPWAILNFFVLSLAGLTFGICNIL